MKKLLVLASLLGCVGALGACNEKKAETQTSSSSACVTCQEVVKDSSTIEDGQVNEVQTVFTGILQEDMQAGDNDSVSIFLKEIEAVTDSEDMVKNFTNDGVILHAPKGKLDLKKGEKVQVVLKGLPIMTMSIPPQIPGNSISEIQVVK